MRFLLQDAFHTIRLLLLHRQRRQLFLAALLLSYRELIDDHHLQYFAYFLHVGEYPRLHPEV
jgi:UDP-N-acetylglucosamine transferase subunit ALG13